MPLNLVLMIGELEVGGTQRQMLELARAIDKTRFSVGVCALSRSLEFSDAFWRAGITVRVLEKHGRFDVTIVPKLRRYLKESRVDALITFGFTADLWGRVAARAAGVPVVISSVRTSMEDSKLLNILNFLLSGLAHRYIANSEAVVHYLTRMGISADRVSLIPNGIDLHRFKDIEESRADIRNALGISPSSFVVGTVSRLSPEKNVAGFVEAASGLALRCKQAEFVVAGDGPELESLRAMAESVGLGSAIHWLGSRDDIPRVLKAFDVAMLTSWREGLSNSLLEYMATGLPIVASDVGGNRSIIQDGVTGYLFPAGDVSKAVEHLHALYSDANLRQRISETAQRDLRERFSVEALAHKTENLILSTTTMKRRAASVS